MSREPQDKPYRWAEDAVPNLGTYVTELFNMLDESMALLVAPHGITTIEYTLLWYCLEREHTATELARVMPVDAARISRIVAGLVEKGMLRRRRLRSDRRIVMLRLTEEGREVASGIARKMRRHYVVLSDGIGEEEMQVFTSVTDRIIANHADSEMSR